MVWGFGLRVSSGLRGLGLKVHALGFRVFLGLGSAWIDRRGWVGGVGGEGGKGEGECFGLKV